MSRAVQVKNRAPAPIQISAEQILREANDRIEKPIKGPKVQITDPEELMQVRGQQRVVTVPLNHSREGPVAMPHRAVACMRLLLLLLLFAHPPV
jgi:hypothetical protein